MSQPELTAVGTGRTIDVAHLDRPAVFLCFAQATQHAADPIEAAIRQKYTPAEVLVGQVVDLHTVPRMFRSVAERILNSEYDKAVAALPAGETPEDYVVILPDWDGAFVKSLALPEDVSEQLAIAVFTRDGTLLGTQQGDGAAEACLQLLANAIA